MTEPEAIFGAKPCPAQNDGLRRARALPFCARNFKGDVELKINRTSKTDLENLSSLACSFVWLPSENYLHHFGQGFPRKRRQEKVDLFH